jgi:hypothetical protein
MVSIKKFRVTGQPHTIRSKRGQIQTGEQHGISRAIAPIKIEKFCAIPNHALTVEVEAYKEA